MERILLRRDTAERWKKSNPILMEGEVGFETDTKMRKIGDGVNRWNDLDFLKAENISQELGDSENATLSQKTITKGFGETLLNRVSLSSQRDLDTITQIGIYSWTNSEVPVGSPVKGLATTIVFPYFTGDGIYTARSVQQVIDYQGKTYTRYKISSGWGTWYSSVREEVVSNISENTLLRRSLLTSNDDLDDIFDIGIYSWISNDEPANKPFNYGGVLIVLPYFLTGYVEKSRTIHIAFSSSGRMYTRYRTTKGWGAWNSSSSSGSGGSGHEDGLIKAFLSKSYTKWIPEGDIPRNSIDKTFYTGTITGLPYSSVFNFGNDIYYQRGLSAFFSAVKNKGSVLYTMSYGEDTRRGAYYGTVCSSFVCYFANQKIYYSTAEMRTILKDIKYVDIEQIAIGDILITDGHCKMVTSVSVDEDGNYNIVITEQGGYNMMETTYDKEGFEKILLGEDPHDPRVFKLGRFPEQSIAVLPKIEYSENIISEYGDRTFFNKGEDVFVTVKNGEYINISDGISINRYPISAFTTKTVNETVMYNLRPYLAKAGEYEIYSDSDTVHSRLSVVDTGTAVLKNTSVQLSAYSHNVRPSWYSVIYIVKAVAETYPYFPAPEGYMGYQADFCKGLIMSDTFEVDIKNIRDYADGYYVRSYYDTKFGLAYKDSNIIMIK